MVDFQKLENRFIRHVNIPSTLGEAIADCYRRRVLPVSHPNNPASKESPKNANI
jgi:hypothetical protein